MTPAEIEKCRKAISETGFMLESRVAELLREKQWGVLGNRYYLDDITSAPREIDLIAYKAVAVEKAVVYTVLIISCKKSDQNVWVFLTKNLNKQDANLELHPVNAWTNSRIMLQLDLRNKMVAEIERSFNSSELMTNLFEIERNVFAYQEVNLANGTPQNDKRIYDSITTCIKAMEYEKNALKARKTQPVTYQFVIVNVVESRLIEYFCDVDPPMVTEVDHVKYLNRFIVNRADDFRIIHFMTERHFSGFLDLMEQYHQWNALQYKNAFEEYRKKFLSDPKLRNLFSDQIASDIGFTVAIRARYALGIDEFDIKSVSLWTDEKRESLVVDIGVSDEKALKTLNSDPWLKQRVALSLKDRASYEGPFEFGVVDTFEDDIPF